MRKIDTIIIHCSYTPPSMDIGVKEIRKWHMKDRGWKDIGYHYVIRRNGIVELGRDFGTAGAHARGHNAHSLGICLVGGKHPGGNRDQTNFTKKQWQALKGLTAGLQFVFGALNVIGHNEVTTKKTCPTFDVQEWKRNGP